MIYLLVFAEILSRFKIAVSWLQASERHRGDVVSIECLEKSRQPPSQCCDYSHVVVGFTTEIPKTAKCAQEQSILQRWQHQRESCYDMSNRSRQGSIEDCSIFERYER
jgi:hypothetical protein